MILTCLPNFFLLLSITLASCILFYILVFYKFFPHVLSFNNLPLFLCSVYSLHAIKILKESIFYPSCVFSKLPILSIFVVCDCAFNIVSSLSYQISYSLDLFLTEYKFPKLLIIALINLHVQGLFNLTSESQEFSPREIYKGSWKNFSVPCSVGFDLFPTTTQAFSYNKSPAIERHILDHSCSFTVTHCNLLVPLLLVILFF